MENNFSSIELVIIRQQLHKLTDEAIAEMLNKPLEQVKMVINKITNGGKIKLSKSQSIEKVKIEKNKKALRKKNKRSVEVIRTAALSKRKEPLYETKPVNYAEMKTVRIDCKTVIYIKPGEDPASAKRKYLDRIEKSKKEEEKKYKR